MSLLSRSLFVVFIFFQIFDIIQAQNSCRSGISCEAGYRCCTVGRDILCCRNTITFWSQWYIWFAVVMFFLLLFSCLVAYRRRQRLRYQQSSAAVAAAAAVRTTTYPPTVPGQMTQHANTPVITDAPPSYDELKIQGISSQFQELQQQKDEESIPSCPAPPYNQAYIIEESSQEAPTTTNDPPAPPYPGV